MFAFCLLALLASYPTQAAQITYSDQEVTEARLLRNRFLEANSHSNIAEVASISTELEAFLERYSGSIAKNVIVISLFEARVALFLGSGPQMGAEAESLSFSPEEEIRLLGELLLEIEPQHFNFHTVAHAFRKCGIHIDEAIELEEEAIRLLGNDKTLRMPRYHLELGKLHALKGNLETSIRHLEKADSLLSHVPDSAYRILSVKHIDRSFIRLALAGVHLLDDASEQSLNIYRELYGDNLDYGSLEDSYRQVLAVSGLDSVRIEETIRQERNRFLDAIAFSLEGEQSDAAVAPSFVLPELQGENVSLEDFSDRVVVLNFWAGWCTPSFGRDADPESLARGVHRTTGGDSFRQRRLMACTND